MSEAPAKSASDVDRVRTAALRAHDAGLSVIPIRADGTKRPDVASWKPYQQNRPARRQVATWLASPKGRTGFAIIAGAVSGGLELFDFDDPDVYTKFVRQALAGPLREVVTKIGTGFHARTPGGHHLVYRCSTIAGNQKLASRLKRPDEQSNENDRIQVLIETRGEGGYFVAPPSSGKVHPSGKAYAQVAGGFDSIATITPEEREALLAFARSFDTIPKEADPTPKPNGRTQPTASTRPGDHYNATADWGELLLGHGWVEHHRQGDEAFWTRPGKNPREGHSATTNFQGSGLLYVFTSATNFEAERTYSLFGAYAVLGHGGDHKAAARAIGEEMSRQNTKVRTSPNPSKAATASPVRSEIPDTDSPTWEPLIPLDEPDPVPFPAEVFPESIRDWVESESVAAQVTVDLPGVVALGVLAAAVGGKARVCVREGYTEPLNTYVVIALPPANRKTQAFSDGTKPILAFEADLSRSMRSQVARAQAEIEVLNDRLKKARKRAVDAAPQDAGKLLAETEDLAERLAKAEREAPTHPRLVADDVTPEALGLLLEQQRGRMAVISAEGGELFEIIGGRYSQNAKPNISVFLNGHAGDPIRVDRIKREPVFVENPALTLCLAVQPEVVRGLTSKTNSVLRGRGLLGRILFSIPRSTLGSRDVAPMPVPPLVSAAYSATVERLLRLPATDSELQFSEGATASWLRFATDLEPKLAENGELGHLGDWAGKLAGAVARLAGILHAAQWADDSDPWAHPIEAAIVERAIQLGHYFTAHAKLAFGLMGATDDVERAMRVWRWIRDEGLTEVGRQDLWQRFKGGTVHKADELDVLLAPLIEHHYLRKRPVPEEERGKPGRKAVVYDVNPEGLAR